jgi:hypothetical protein
VDITFIAEKARGSTGLENAGPSAAILSCVALLVVDAAAGPTRLAGEVAAWLDCLCRGAPLIALHHVIVLAEAGPSLAGVTDALSLEAVLLCSAAVVV